MLTNRMIAFACLVALAGALAPIAGDVPTVEAAGASIYWGAFIDGTPYGLPDPPSDVRAMDTFEANAKKKMSIFHWGQSWMNPDGSWA